MKRYKIDQLRFLIVDPNKHMHVIFREVLYALGVRELQFARGAKEALKVLQGFRPDVIITELVMEPLDGIEFTKLIRQHAKTVPPFTPVIVATAYTEARKVLAARDAGITEFLAKPISAGTLYSRIYTIIEYPRDFVRTKDFFGPDRRRRQIDQECRRRESDRLAAEAEAEAEARELAEARAAADAKAKAAAEAKAAADAKAAAEAEARAMAQAEASAAELAQEAAELAQEMGTKAKAAADAKKKGAEEKAAAEEQARIEAELAASSQAEVAAMLERDAGKK